MKRLAALTYLFLAFVLLLPVFVLAETLPVKVLGVVDGDTITVLLKNKSQKQVDIKGIDAPELKQAFGTEARQKLTELVFNKNVVLEYAKVKPNGEILGKVFLNGKDIGLEMLKTGYAWCDTEQEELLDLKDSSAYCDSEDISHRMLTGLWQDQAAVSPWEFRKNFIPEDNVQKTDIRSSTVFEGRVMEVVDGATIAIKMANNSRLAICISRLETPEPGQPKAAIAEQHLKDLLLQKNVRFTISGFPEDETVTCVSGDVYLNGININLQMVRDGVAWVNKNYFYPEGYYTYELTEQSARSERRGIWEDVAPMAPWEYRAQIYRAEANNSSSAFSGSGGYGGGSSSYGGNKTVRVRSYTRSDGTFVRSHTRSAPRSGGGGRSGRSGRGKN